MATVKRWTFITFNKSLVIRTYSLLMYMNRASNTKQLNHQKDER
jgi:hypothetical protein